MLNEIAEYMQYSFDTTDTSLSMGSRLLYGYLCREDPRSGKINFSGLERAMTVVARYYMYDTGAKDPQRAQLMLQAWCGTVNVPEQVKITTVYNWLHDYILNILLKSKVNELKGKKKRAGNGRVYLSDKMWLPENIFEMFFSDSVLSDESELFELAKQLLTEDSLEYESAFSQYIKPIINCISAIQKLPEKRKGFGKSMFDQSVVTKGKADSYSGENDYKAIRYDKILAEASNLGPLRKYYLLLDDKEEVRDLVKNDKEMDMLLKTVSAFLLGKTFDEQKYVAVNFTDILNWQNNPKDDDYRKWRDKVCIHEESVFKTEIMQNQAKLSILPSFIKHFDIAEEATMNERWKEYKNAHPNAVYYDDRGSLYQLDELKEYCKP